MAIRTNKKILFFIQNHINDQSASPYPISNNFSAFQTAIPKYADLLFDTPILIGLLNSLVREFGAATIQAPKAHKGPGEEHLPDFSGAS